jgi:GH15 family glucan-1,4-alpha-glucosidase
MSISVTDPSSLLGAVDRARVDALAQHSVRLILDQQAATGAYPASPTFRVYRYSWFRDGAFIADAMSRAGERQSAGRFFDWCAGVVVRRAGRIESILARRAAGEPVARDEYLACRFTLDGDEVEGEDWWDFQLDGYGTWLWALAAHLRRHRDGTVSTDCAAAVELTVRYLLECWNEPCYDWWEEHADERHTSTLAAIFAGLSAAAELAWLAPEQRVASSATAGDIRELVLREGVRDGRLTKWLGSEEVDASLIAAGVPFGLLAPGDPIMTATIAALEDGLAHGGVHRYAADTYFGGGEWVLLAAMLGSHHAAVGQTERAVAQLLWVADQATPGGDLPEQVSGHLLAPERYEGWVERWGTVATPLLWSHAMFLTLADDLGLLAVAAE